MLPCLIARHFAIFRAPMIFRVRHVSDAAAPIYCDVDIISGRLIPHTPSRHYAMPDAAISPLFLRCLLSFTDDKDAILLRFSAADVYVAAATLICCRDVIYFLCRLMPMPPLSLITAITYIRCLSC